MGYPAFPKFRKGNGRLQGFPGPAFSKVLSRQNLWRAKVLASVALACLILQKPAQANPCRTAAIHVAWETKTPLHILNAIAKVESAFNPYDFNTEGTPRRFDNKSQAAIYLQRMIEEKRSVDVGCMQMNIRWHLQRFKRPEDMLDPLANMRAAQLYLDELRRQCGDWECAAGAFHNMRDPAANRRYRCKLANELNPQGNYHYCSKEISVGAAGS